jgi:simple sugar transport system ATP-binding protein
MQGIVKDFPLVRALDDVSFTLNRGSIHSLLGENGAGKSTLMNILYGMCKADAGTITIDDKPVVINNPREAIACGIGMVHQHFMLAPILSVAENIVVGCEPEPGICFDVRKAANHVQNLIDRYHFNMQATDRVSSLSVGVQQRVEILKALYHGSEILILDEPTAVLTPQEVDELFVILRMLRAEGKSIILITHKLKETLAIADTFSVLRDGALIADALPVADTDERTLAQMMVGRNINFTSTNRTKVRGDECLRIENLNLVENGKEILRGIGFSLHHHEILGIAGIEGNGQSELIEVLTGLRAATCDRFLYEGGDLEGNAKEFLENHIGHVPEDRSTRGLIAQMSIEENLILGYHRKREFSRRGFFSSSKVNDFANRQISSFQIKAGSGKQRCSTLSGGNQQKVVIARVFSEDPNLIIVAQPTRGVDIGAMDYIHEQLFSLRDAGKAILLISADLDEVLRLSDRIAVLYEGRLVSISENGTYGETELGLMMTGSHQDGAHYDQDRFE